MEEQQAARIEALLEVIAQQAIEVSSMLKLIITELADDEEDTSSNFYLDGGRRDDTL